MLRQLSCGKAGSRSSGRAPGQKGGGHFQRTVRSIYKYLRQVFSAELAVGWISSTSRCIGTHGDGQATCDRDDPRARRLRVHPQEEHQAARGPAAHRLGDQAGHPQRLLRRGLGLHRRREWSPWNPGRGRARTVCSRAPAPLPQAQIGQIAERCGAKVHWRAPETATSTASTAST